MEALDQLSACDGFYLAKKIANGLVSEAYQKMLSDTDPIKVNYNRGVVGGLESLFQNLELQREGLRAFVDELRQDDKEIETEESIRASELGIGEMDEDV